VNHRFSILVGLALASAAFSQNPNQLSEVEKCQGFASLFDGNAATFRNQFVNYIRGQDNNTNLDAAWGLDAATQSITNSGADIRSKVKYRDFDLRMTYKNTGNQGVYYRFTTAAAWPYETGVELAIDNEPTPREGPKSSAGAAYDMWAPSPYTYKAYSTSDAAWNELRVVVKKDSAEHWLNGVKVVGFRYHSDAWWSAYDNSKWARVGTYSMKVPGDRRGGYISDGYIGLQGTHGGKWFIRNFRILSDSTKVAMGPVSTTCTPTGLGSERDKSSFGITTEPLAGALRVRSSDKVIRSIHVSGLDGRSIPVNTRFEGRGEAAVLSGWGQPGVYLLKAIGSDRSVRHVKILFH
jgi:hypothetical protein